MRTVAGFAYNRTIVPKFDNGDEAANANRPGD
jgi:hypothetical protein